MPWVSGSTHICTKWTGSSALAFISLWRMPRPADMRCARPGYSTPWLPSLSRCSSVPDSTHVTISMSRWPCVPKPRARGDDVVVVDEQQAVPAVPGRVVLAEVERVLGVEPTRCRSTNRSLGLPDGDGHDRLQHRCERNYSDRSHRCRAVRARATTRRSATRTPSSVASRWPPSASGTSTTCGTPTVTHPAATADRTPVGESSIAMHRDGSTPSSAAAARYGSGCGLPFVTSSPATIALERARRQRGDDRLREPLPRHRHERARDRRRCSARRAARVRRAATASARGTRSITPSSSRLTMSSTGSVDARRASRCSGPRRAGRTRPARARARRSTRRCRAGGRRSCSRRDPVGLGVDERAVHVPQDRGDGRGGRHATSVGRAAFDLAAPTRAQVLRLSDGESARPAVDVQRRARWCSCSRRWRSTAPRRRSRAARRRARSAKPTLRALVEVLEVPRLGDVGEERSGHDAVDAHLRPEGARQPVGQVFTPAFAAP